MITREVKRNGWTPFCERVTHGHAGAMVNIRHVDGQGQAVTVAENVPLRALLLDSKGDPCSDHLLVEAGEADQKPIRHEVVEPIHIRLKNGDNDRYNALHILAEDGTTIIELRPGLMPAVLDGLD